jgi:hypothetical protein
MELFIAYSVFSFAFVKGWLSDEDTLSTKLISTTFAPFVFPVLLGMSLRSNYQKSK